LIDATEFYTNSDIRLKINSILYSHYKGHTTLTFLIGVDAIGTTWDEMVSNGYGGSISDPQITRISERLSKIPFGMFMEFDKGFLMENDCVKEGVGVVRQIKMMTGQTQQSSSDTALTQKVGNTQIAVEKVNGGVKLACRSLDRNISTLQLGLAPLIMKIF